MFSAAEFVDNKCLYILKQSQKLNWFYILFLQKCFVDILQSLDPIGCRILWNQVILQRNEMKEF